jgi:hypothetical protein
MFDLTIKVYSLRLSCLRFLFVMAYYKDLRFFVNTGVNKF